MGKRNEQKKIWTAAYKAETEQRFAGYEKNPVMTGLKTLLTESLRDGNTGSAAGDEKNPLFHPDAGQQPIKEHKTHSISNSGIKDMTDSIGHLFTLPDHVMKITQMIQSYKATVENVCDEISKDPSLSAEILKIVNSSFYGLPHQVSSIRHAVVILGFNVIHALVLSFSVVTMGSIKELWNHSEICAKTCAMLAHRARLKKIEEIAVIGLLHDIGKVVLEEYLPEKFEAVIKLMHRERMTLYDAERIILGCTHAEIGKWLLGKWNLPADICAPIGNHHNVHLDAPHQKRTFIVHASDILVNAVYADPSKKVMLPMLHPQTFAALGLEAEDIRWTLSAIAGQMKP